MKQYFGLVLDWETSGLRNHETPWCTYLEGPQGIEIGAILVTLPTFEPLGEFASLVKFLGVHNGLSYGGAHYERLTWSESAQEVHGLSLVDLVNAPSPTEVSEKLTAFVISTARISDPQKTPIMVCGHNPDGDSYYLRQLLYLGGAERKIRFHSRMLDSFTMGYLLYGTRDSTELFELTSGVRRGTHRALEDARLTLAAFRHGMESVRMSKKLVDDELRPNTVTTECRLSQTESGTER